jgi:hypothetical protein
MADACAGSSAARSSIETLQAAANSHDWKAVAELVGAAPAQQLNSALLAGVLQSLAADMLLQALTSPALRQPLHAAFGEQQANSGLLEEWRAVAALAKALQTTDRQPQPQPGSGDAQKAKKVLELLLPLQRMPADRIRQHVTGTLGEVQAAKGLFLQLLQVAIVRGAWRALTQFQGLPAAQNFSSAEVLPLLQAAVPADGPLAGKDSTEHCQALSALLQLPGAQGLGAEAAQGLLQKAVDSSAWLTVKVLAALPGAKQVAGDVVHSMVIQLLPLGAYSSLHPEKDQALAGLLGLAAGGTVPALYCTLIRQQQWRAVETFAKMPKSCATTDVSSAVAMNVLVDLIVSRPCDAGDHGVAPAELKQQQVEHMRSFEAVLALPGANAIGKDGRQVLMQHALEVGWSHVVYLLL